jgi:hypothetical protein
LLIGRLLILPIADLAIADFGWLIWGLPIGDCGSAISDL